MAACRYDVLVFSAARLACADVDLVPECDEPAAYKAILSTDSGGFVVEITAPVCPVHEAHVSQNTGFKRSIRIRQT